MDYQLYPQGQTLYGSAPTVAEVGKLYATNPELAIKLAADNGKAWALAFEKAVESARLQNEKILALYNRTPQQMVSPSAQQSRRVIYLRQRPDGLWEPCEPSQQKASVDAPAKKASQASSLKTHCANCHGKDKVTPAGGMYLDADVKLNAEQIVRALEILRGTDVPETMTQVVKSLGPSDKGALMEDLLNAQNRE